MNTSRFLPHARNVGRLATGRRSVRREILRDYYFRLSRAVTPVILARGEGMDFLVSTNDDVVGRDLFRSGSFDLGPMRAILGELRERRPDTFTRRVFLDAGANIGTTSVAAIRRFGLDSVIAVEPDPENFRLLELNLRLNDLTERSRAHRVALSDAEGELRILRSRDNSGDHRVVVAPPAPGSDADVVTVPATTLDALLRKTGTDPSDVALVWMDVQGHEGHVLAGCESLLDVGTPIVVEFWPEALRGANGLEQLIAIVRDRFKTVIDMGSPYAQHRPPARALPARDVEQLADRYVGREFADLILLP